MAVSKITEKQITDNGVVSAADVLTGSIPENKSVFDKLPRFIITVLNGLIDKFNDSESSKITDVRVNGVSKVTNNIANITVDSDVSDVSENPISNKAAKAYADKLKWASASVAVDDVLSDTSANPVQNKVVTNKFTEVDSAISSVSATAMTNLDKAEENINQNISNIQNALNAEVTNRESAVTSLGNSISENTNQINNIMNANSDSGWLELDVSKIHTTNVANDSTINSASVRRVGKRVELYVSFQLESNQNGEFNLMFGNAIKSKFNGQDLRPSSDADKFDSFMYVKQLNGNKALSYAYLYYYDGELGVNIIPLETLSELATCILHIGWFCN